MFVSWLAYYVENYLAYSVLQLLTFPAQASGKPPPNPIIPNLTDSVASKRPGGAIRLHQACLLFMGNIGVESFWQSVLILKNRTITKLARLNAHQYRII